MLAEERFLIFASYLGELCGERSGEKIFTAKNAKGSAKTGNHRKKKKNSFLCVLRALEAGW